MFRVLGLFGALLAWIRGSRASRDAEILFLRQQLLVLRRSAPARVRLRNSDRLIFACLYRLFPSLLDAAVIFRPETLMRWHRGGFRLFWRWKSRRRRGRPVISSEVRSLVRQMSHENPLWGAPRIHGELLKLGIDISQSPLRSDGINGRDRSLPRSSAARIAAARASLRRARAPTDRLLQG